MATFLVWGCGQWLERRRLIDPEDIGQHVVYEEMPEFDLLPPDFVDEWAQNFGSEHWAELIDCDEEELDAATRFCANVYGWKEV